MLNEDFFFFYRSKQTSSSWFLSLYFSLRYQLEAKFSLNKRKYQTPHLYFSFTDFFCRHGSITFCCALFVCWADFSLFFASPSFSLNFICLDVRFLFPVSWYAFRSATLAVVVLFSSIGFLAVVWFGGVLCVSIWVFRTRSQLCWADCSKF